LKTLDYVGIVSRFALAPRVKFLALEKRSIRRAHAGNREQVRARSVIYLPGFKNFWRSNALFTVPNGQFRIRVG
jgi:hypothetical protein